jgi:hypothetical protein
MQNGLASTGLQAAANQKVQDARANRIMDFT